MKRAAIAGMIHGFIAVIPVWIYLGGSWSTFAAILWVAFSGDIISRWEIENESH